MIFINTLQSLAAEFYIFTVVIILLLYSIINNKYIIIKNISILAVYSIIISIIILSMNPYIYLITLNNAFILDNFSLVIKLIVLIGSVSCIIMSLDYLKDQKIYSYEYVLLLLLSIIALLLLLGSFNLISIYLAIELQSLSFYVLASMKKDSEYSTEASFKYFILGVFSSGFLLLGFSILYGFTGIINIEQLYKLSICLNYLGDNYIIAISLGLLLIIVSLLFKLGAVPFHMWLPDVYEGSPLSVTAFFAIVPKIVILTVIFRIFIYSFYEIVENINNVFVYCSIASMILASIAALYQVKIIRLLVYSAIGHIGYILIGVSVGSIESIQASIMYILIYIIMSINIYSTIISIKAKNKSIEIKYLKELTNLSKYNPLLAISLTFMLFSMAGIPPLAGFFSKLYLFASAMNESMYNLTIIGILTSVIGTVYYIYIIRLIYFEKSNSWIFLTQMNKSLSILISITLIIITLLFLYASSILIYTHKLSLFLAL
uniref:NADH dehydrogenase subunit 2 n=1 Tax=Malawimonas californiana TaxID=221722 RepID=A0A0B5GNL9_MALCL|nr:NADH dehydrogenase subunit 2 [Malawimonas californiana]AJF22854.1 NADH dehydrogenase subunit 2 [Malawimonas californiana]